MSAHGLIRAVAGWWEAEGGKPGEASSHDTFRADTCPVTRPFLQPLTLTVPKSNRRAPTPRLLLSVLILPPRPPAPVRNRAAEAEEEPELPEMEIGTFQIDLALKGDFRSRVQWEQLKSGLREEEDKWNREGG